MAGRAVTLKRGRSNIVVPSCSAQAISSVRTVASTLVRCVLRIWLSRRSCFIFFKYQLDLPAHAIDREHVCGRPRRRLQGGDEQQPAGHQQGGGGDSPARFLCFAALAVPGLLRGLGIKFGRNESHPIALLLPLTPPRPLPLGTPPLTQPPQHVEGRAPHRFRAGRWLGAHGPPRRRAAAPPEPHCGDSHSHCRPRSHRQPATCTDRGAHPPAVRHLHLAQAPCYEVIG